MASSNFFLTKNIHLFELIMTKMSFYRIAFIDRLQIYTGEKSENTFISLKLYQAKNTVNYGQG